MKLSVLIDDDLKLLAIFFLFDVSSGFEILSFKRFEEVYFVGIAPLKVQQI